MNRPSAILDLRKTYRTPLQDALGPSTGSTHHFTVYPPTGPAEGGGLAASHYICNISGGATAAEVELGCIEKGARTALPQLRRMGNQLSVTQIASWKRLFLSILLIVSTAEGQPPVTNTLFRANARHTLSCERESQLDCSWRVQRNGTGPFHQVEVGTELVRASSLPGDVDILLNEETKGIYECHCRLNGGQKAVVRKRVFFYSAGKWVGR